MSNYKRNSADMAIKKIPIRTPRFTEIGHASSIVQQTHQQLTKKYLAISVNAFYFRKT